MRKYYQDRLSRVNILIEYYFAKGLINGVYHKQFYRMCHIQGIYEMRMGYLVK